MPLDLLVLDPTDKNYFNKKKKSTKITALKMKLSEKKNTIDIIMVQQKDEEKEKKNIRG